LGFRRRLGYNAGVLLATVRAAVRTLIIVGDLSTCPQDQARCAYSD
jgi:hypothetical protein